jgi:hypothetical protein
MALQIRVSAPILNRMRIADNMRRIALDCLFVAILGANVTAGALAFKKTLPVVFQWAGPTIPDSMKEQIAVINSVVPDGAPVFFIKEGSDLWLPRVWQRALHPHPVFLITSREQLQSPEYSRFKKEYSIRHAVSAGAPPIDPSFVRSRNIEPPGTAETLLVGELAP